MASHARQVATNAWVRVDDVLSDLLELAEELPAGHVAALDLAELADTLRSAKASLAVLDGLFAADPPPND